MGKMDHTKTIDENRARKQRRRWRKIMKALLWSAAFLLALMLIGAGVLHIEEVQQRLKTLAVAMVEKRTGLEMELGSISGNLISHLSLESVQLATDGRPLVRADRILIRYDLAWLLRGVVRIHHLEIENPHVHLIRDSAGNWNFHPLLPAAAAPAPSPPASKARIQFRLDRLSLSRGALSVRSSASRHPLRKQVEDITIDARLKWETTLEARISNAAFTLPSYRLALRETSGTVRWDPNTDELTVATLKMRTVASELSIKGRISGLSTDPDMALFADIRALAVAELGRALSMPALDDGVVSGRIEVRGSPDRLQHRLTLGLGRQTADVSGVLSGIRSGSPSLEAAGALQRLNPKKWPGTGGRLPSGDIRAEFTLSGQRLLQADRGLRLGLKLGPGQLAEYPLSGGAIDIRLQNGDLVLKDARLASAGLNVRLQGLLEEIDTGSGPASFRIEASARDFDTQALGLPRGFDGRLTADLKARFAGKLSVASPLEFDDWRASATLSIDRYRLNGIDIRRGDLQATWNGRTVEMQSLHLDSDLVRTTLNGAFSDAGNNFRVGGRAVIDDLGRFYALLLENGLPVPAEPIPEGKVRINGSIQRLDGNSDIRADLQADGLQVKRLHMESAAVNLSIRGGTGRSLIQIDKVRISTIREPLTGVIPEVVNTAPIRIEFHPDRIDIMSLQLAAGKTRMTSEGRLAPHGLQDLTIQLTDLDMNRLAFLWNPNQDLSGLLSLRSRLRGSLAAPQIAADIGIKGLGRSTAGTFSEIEARLSYRDKRASWTVAGNRAQRHIFDLTGSSGLTLRLHPFEFHLTPDSFSGRLEAEQLDLANLPLPRLPGFELKGSLRINARADGDIRRPQVHGTLVLQKGSLTSTRYGISYESVAAELAFTPQRVTIQKLELAGDREGVLSGSGDITLEGLQPTAFNLHIVGEQLALDWNRTVWVKFDSTLSLAGRMTSPVITGKLNVRESRINLDRLAESGPAEIVVMEPPGSGQNVIIVEDIAERRSFFSALTVDIHVTVRGNSWLKGQGLRAEIAGTGDIKKTAAGPLRLFGALSTVRGNYEFQRRLFTITQGKVEFSGLAEPDPNLDMRAETKIRDAVIFVHLTGSARRIQLSLESDPPMEKSEIVAYLVFGRSTDDLRWQQSSSAEIAALNLTGKIAASELQKILAETLGLDMVTFDLGSEDIRTGSLAIGKYVTRNIFVTYRHGFATTDLGQVEVDYRINKNFSVQTQVGDELSTGIDLIWQHDF